MTTDEVEQALSPDLPQIRAQLHHAGLAHYLAGASLAELAHVVAALSAELVTVRGYAMAEPLGLVAARLEYYQETGR